MFVHVRPSVLLAWFPSWSIVCAERIALMRPFHFYCMFLFGRHRLFILCFYSSMAIFTILNQPIHEHGRSFLLPMSSSTSLFRPLGFLIVFFFIGCVYSQIYILETVVDGSVSLILLKCSSFYIRIQKGCGFY